MGKGNGLRSGVDTTIAWWTAIFVSGLVVWAITGIVGSRVDALPNTWWAWWALFGLGYVGQNTRLEQSDEGWRSRIGFASQVMATLGMTSSAADVLTPTGSAGGPPAPNLFIFGPFLLVVTAARAASFVAMPGGLVLILGQTVWVIVVAGLDLRGNWRHIGMAFGLVAFQLLLFSYGSLAQSQQSVRRSLTTALAHLRVSNALLAERSRREQRSVFLRDLHDSAGHSLTALGLLLEKAATSSEPERREAIVHAEKIRRELAHDLREVGSERRRDLVEAIEQLVNTTNTAYPEGTVSADIRIQSASLDPQVSEVLYRAAQEGLTNALRHSGAKTIALRLQQDGSTYTLRIDDNGDGSPATGMPWPEADRVRTPGQGLDGLRHRVEHIGGTVQTRTGIPTGFTLIVEVSASEERGQNPS